MIVRISSEGQYDVPDDVYDELNELDNLIVAQVEGGDETAFAGSFAELMELVRSTGRRLEGDDLSESSIILPPPDLSFAEAGEQFTGEGILPD